MLSKGNGKGRSEIVQLQETTTSACAACSVLTAHHTAAGSCYLTEMNCAAELPHPFASIGLRYFVILTYSG